ncbi:MAG: bifunctional 3-deoxy-7-phosphoheptulonate synthase/chorismate mutase type II [Bacteroidales bacterium]|nr:bifunctional 3-deoxy-7-phosphoheptulonate synthase/chorismate mutase type II [Bacteroidales bacterium]
MAKQLELIPISEWGLFTEDPKPYVIAGPCSAETEEQVMETAKGLRAFGINVFRAGIWKPRTHPGNFEGIGTEGLKWLQKVKKETGLKVCTEVASAKHIFDCLKYGIDMVWVGARTSANPFLMQEIADALSGTDIPVLVKNPVNPDLDLWIGALERLNNAGIKKLGVIHRGFSTAEKKEYRNDPGWQIAIELRTRYPELPFFADPSHMGGSRKFLQEISQKSMDLGLEGLMVESHCNPDCALSDSKQQLVPADLQVLLESLRIREKSGDSEDYKKQIDHLRAQIDIIDENLLYMLNSRMQISRKIGQFKKENNVAILQATRWDSLLAKAVESGAKYGLPEKLVVSVMNAIHDASVEAQNEILSKEDN